MGARAPDGLALARTTTSLMIKADRWSANNNQSQGPDELETNSDHPPKRIKMSGHTTEATQLKLGQTDDSMPSNPFSFAKPHAQDDPLAVAVNQMEEYDAMLNDEKAVSAHIQAVGNGQYLGCQPPRNSSHLRFSTNHVAEKADKQIRQLSQDGLVGGAHCGHSQNGLTGGADDGRVELFPQQAAEHGTASSSLGFDNPFFPEAAFDPEGSLGPSARVEFDFVVGSDAPVELDAAFSPNAPFDLDLPVDHDAPPMLNAPFKSNALLELDFSLHAAVPPDLANADMPPAAQAQTFSSHDDKQVPQTGVGKSGRKAPGRSGQPKPQTYSFAEEAVIIEGCAVNASLRDIAEELGRPVGQSIEHKIRRMIREGKLPA